MPRYARRKVYRQRSGSTYSRKRRATSRMYGKSRRYARTIPVTNMRVKGLISADRTYLAMKYVNDTTAINSSSFYSLSFGGNDLYSPDLSRLTGWQPTGYDQWTPLYTRSCVLGSKIKVTFTNMGGVNTKNPVELAIMPYYNAGAYTTNTPGVTDMNTLRSQKYIKTTVLGGQQSAQQVVSLTNYMSTSKITGHKDPVTEESFHGVMSTTSLTYGDPPLCWFWGIFAQGSGGQAARASMLIEITYYVVLLGRKGQLRS